MGMRAGRKWDEFIFLSLWESMLWKDWQLLPWGDLNKNGMVFVCESEREKEREKHQGSKLFSACGHLYKPHRFLHTTTKWRPQETKPHTHGHTCSNESHIEKAQNGEMEVYPGLWGSMNHGLVQTSPSLCTSLGSRVSWCGWLECRWRVTWKKVN